MSLPSLTLTRAKILRPAGMTDAPLTIADGRISEGGGRVLDLSGFLVLPGIIDLHGDGFERHLAPRRGAATDLAQGLAATDAELAACGITTAMLAQFFSWEGGMRGPDFAEAVAGALSRSAPLTDLHLQLRLEINLLSEYERALTLAVTSRISYLVFNDHLPHAALAAGKRPPRLTGQALKSGRSPEAHLAYLQALHAASAEVAQALPELAARARRAGVRLGSHDDSCTETRDRFRAIGAEIAEFPETLATALAAKSAGDAVILGAPNVVRGGSHDKKVSAIEVIAAGACDGLVSDYHYPSLKTAALALVKRGVLDLAGAWALISSGPAKIMGWTDRGRLAPGARADLVMLEEATGRVAGTIAGGQVSYLSGDLANRFLAREAS